MKNSTFLIIILAIALVGVSYKWVTSTNSKANTIQTASGNPVYENIMSRSSVRAYSDKKISNEQIDTLLHAAMAAPTAVNKQPWRILVLQDKALQDSISANMNSMKMATDASAVIILCGDMDATFEKCPDYWVQDVSAATENLLLAAHSMGIGAVWCGVYPVTDRVNWFQKIFKMPDNIIPLACVCLGYPSAANTPKDKWIPEHVHYNTWDNIYKSE